MSSRSSASPDAQPVPLGAQSVDRSGCTGWGLGPVTVLSPSYEGLLTPTILTPGCRAPDMVRAEPKAVTV
jgi:hypothetical protein